MVLLFPVWLSVLVYTAKLLKECCIRLTLSIEILMFAAALAVESWFVMAD